MSSIRSLRSHDESIRTQTDCNTQNAPPQPLIIPESNPSDRQQDYNSCVGWRHIVAVMTFFGFFSCMSQRVAFTVALVAMVNSSYEDSSTKNLSTDACPMPEILLNSTEAQQTGDFNWDPSTQSLLIGAMFYGYIVTQLPGGVLSERIGARLVFGLTGFLSGVITLLTPLFARWDVKVLVASRILLGLAQGPLYPSNHAIWGQWAPVYERSWLFTLSTAGANIAYFSFYIISGYLCDSSFLGGWPSPLYITGGFSCLWFIFWMLLTSDSPAKHRFISDKEKNYIENSLGGVKVEYTSPPWKCMFTSRAVLCQWLYALCDGIGFYIIFSVLPFYMKEMLHYDISQDGLASAWPYIASFPVALSVGPLADLIRKKRWLSTTAVRKLFTLIGEGGMGICLFAIAFVECDHTMVVTLVTLGYGVVGLSGAGCVVAALDYAPRYAGTLMGLSNPWGNVGGFVSPLLANLLTKGEASRSKWQRVFILAAGIMWAGVLIFLLLGTSELQPWAVGKGQKVRGPEREVREEEGGTQEQEEEEEEEEGDQQPLIQ